ncbi:MAG TPA: fimbrial protein [Steroidobacteraceae bacterium]|nr:fimbrial protein [Steroidobacteraceae bacterium]
MRVVAEIFSAHAGANNMNICITRALLAAGGAMSALGSMSGLASDGTITFTGAVTENTCMVRVNGAGSGDGAVALPVVDADALSIARARKSPAAGTYFNISVSQCTANRTVAAYFEAGPNVDAATHALINTGTSNVEVKLYEASSPGMVGSPISPGTTAATQAAVGAGAWHFYAGYSLADGEARPGTVSTSITYSLVYL